MPEYDSIEKMPQYTQANVDYQVALKNAGDDETAQLRAKLEWSDTRTSLEAERQRFNSEHRAIEDARERVKNAYPDVPASIYARASTPEEMEQAAKEFDEAVKARTTPAAPVDTGAAPSGAALGQPPAGLTNNTVPQDQQWAVELGELRQKINEGRATFQEVQRFQDIKMDYQMLPAAKKAKEEAKSGR